MVPEASKVRRTLDQLFRREAGQLVATLVRWLGPGRLDDAECAVQDAMRAFGYPVEQAFAISRRLHHAEPGDGAEAIRSGLAALVGLKVDDARGDIPQGADEPTVNEVNISEFPVLVVTLSGDLPERVLSQAARHLRDAIEEVPGVLEGSLQGARDDLVETIEGWRNWPEEERRVSEVAGSGASARHSSKRRSTAF